MNKKMSKRQKDIKSKLMAAICMLLVSSIMMVSTTYAWFTLSTAPEVTGISTAVGANGNLEMALMPLSGKTQDITSAVGDSINVKDKTLANVTWGNLVDLKNAYGLENITLYPSALNTDETSGNINTSFPVSIPEYGVDGRVTTLSANKAMPGSWEAGVFKDKVIVKTGEAATDDFMGVRAIGVASGASPAQLEYKAAIMNASQAATNAQNKARGALITKGGALADIAISYVNNGDAAEYTSADINNLQFMLDALYGTEDEPGALLIIQNALKEYIVADYISKNPEGYETMADTIRGLTTLDTTAAYIPDGMKTMIGNLNTAMANAKAAQDAMPKGSEPYSWSDISAVVDKLAKTEKMNLNGFAIGELTSKISELMSDVMGGKGITLYLQSGAGVFVDIADFCGDYAAPVTIPEISYGDYHMKDVPVTMQTQSDVDKAGDPYLTQAKSAIASAPGAGSSSTLPLSDFYGYIIDLAFRTNVAGSNLQLQTAAVDRIYTDSTANEATMGGGSTMIFKSSDTNFTPARMIELMKHLKVILFDPTNGEVIKNLVITNLDTEIITDADGTVTAPLYVANAEGTGPAMREVDGVEEKDPTIMALDQNAIYQLSALVYLDGTNLTNANVANAAKSMVGALNLQFSSSADLVPMEYADLRNGTVTAPEGDDDTTPVPLTNVTSTVDGTSVTVGTAALVEGKIVIQLNNWTDETVSVKIGDAQAQTIVPSTNDEGTAVIVTAPGGFEANTTAIAVTVTAAG